MNIYELVIDEQAEVYGIDAISLVSKPAIQRNFVALSEEPEHIVLQDMEQQLVMGPALIPDKPIYRRRGKEEFYVYFSKKTVRRSMELYFRSHNQSNATLEHEAPVYGVYAVESWIVEDPKQDKSAIYGMEMPKGTWMVSMKIDNAELWSKYVKEGKVSGFSIEGYFVDGIGMKQPQKQSSLLEELEVLCQEAVQK